MNYNYNYSNTYSDSDFTPTSFNSDVINPTFHNFNQSSMSDWSYLSQYMLQPQYYEQDWDDHHHSSPSQWGYNSPGHSINNLTNIQLHILLIKINYRRKIFFRKEFRSLLWVHAIIPNLDRLKFPVKFPNPRSLLHFSSPTQQELSDLEKSVEYLIQSWLVYNYALLYRISPPIYE